MRKFERILVRFPELGSNYLITLENRKTNQDEMIVES